MRYSLLRKHSKNRYLFSCLSVKLNRLFLHNEVVSIKLKQGSKKRFVSVGRVNVIIKSDWTDSSLSKFLENASDYELVFIGGWDETYKKEMWWLYPREPIN